MKQSGRTRMTVGDFLVALGILALAVVLALFLIPRQTQQLTLRVVQDGQLLLSCPMEQLVETTELSVSGDYPLVLQLSRDGVYVKQTSCPGEDCRHMGTIHTAGQQIVCLPNRLVVTLEGDSVSYDAMTG